MPICQSLESTQPSFVALDFKAAVSGYSHDLPSQMIDVVDVAWAFDNPFSHKTYILVAQNAMYIPSMGHNLIAPIIMHEAGLEVNEQAKCSAVDPLISQTSQHF